jgi:hypothetical protein
MFTDVPTTEHTAGVVDVNVTARLDDAVAETVNADSSYVLSDKEPKLIVCDARPIVTVPATYVMS